VAERSANRPRTRASAARLDPPPGSIRRASSGSTQEQAPHESPTRTLTGHPEINRSPPAPRTCTIESPSTYRQSGRGIGVTSTANINGSPARAGANPSTGTRRSRPASTNPWANDS
jgi:hypothetical protein